VTDRRESGSEVWTANRDGTDALSLTKGAQRTLGSPRWSPNARFLAFDGRGEDGNWHVFVIDAAGGSPRALPSGPFNDSRPSWSGDGMSIYFDSDRSGRSAVWRIPATGGDAQQVTHNEGMAPLDSPDGKTLFFIRLVENQRAVFAMPVAGGPEHKILDAINAWQYAPAETGIYYVPASQQGQQPGEYSVRFLDYATGKSRTVGTIHAEYFGNGLSVSPDGKVLVNGVASVGADLMMIDSFR
jgi:Tol biopolymer transport system component